VNQGSGEKTERATPKKRRDARERGQVFKSTEINTAVCCLVMFSFLLLYWKPFIEKTAELIKAYLGNVAASANTGKVTIQLIQKVSVELMIRMAIILLPILGVALVTGLLVNIVQVGFLFTTKPLAFQLERISPLKGFQRIFSSRTLVELAKSALKIIVLSYVFYREYRVLILQLPSLMRTELYTSFLEILKIASRIALRMSMALAALAAFDYLYQWWKYEQDLMMTKHEVKEEYKLVEGDPLIKSRIRQKQRQMSAMRMMEQVPSADVVVTNPTHYAVALKYEDTVSSAPTVIAKGKDYLAQRIKEVARENSVELVENREVAQALYMYCDIGDEIPEELYQAVADILVHVYRLKNRARGAAG